MKAEIEWVTGVLRVGKSFKKHGDPYEFACTVIQRGTELELVGGTGSITPSIWKAIRVAFIAAGITLVTWERANGRIVRIVYDR